MRRINDRLAQVVRYFVSSIERLTGAHQGTILTLLARVGEKMERFLEDRIKDVENSLGMRVDYAKLIKVYGTPGDGEQRYSPAEVISIEVVPVSGNPDPAKICTSHVERQNLTLLMSMRRFTRLTNGFSKKLENHRAAIALHFAITTSAAATRRYG